MNFPDFMDESEGYEKASDAGEAYANGWNAAINSTAALNDSKVDPLRVAVKALLAKMPASPITIAHYHANVELLAVREFLDVK